jgi:hypothetical protein
MRGLIGRQERTNPLRQAATAAGLFGKIGQMTGLEELCEGAGALVGHQSGMGVNIFPTNA